MKQYRVNQIWRKNGVGDPVVLHGGRGYFEKPAAERAAKQKLQADRDTGEYNTTYEVVEVEINPHPDFISHGGDWVMRDDLGAPREPENWNEAEYQKDYERMCDLMSKSELTPEEREELDEMIGDDDEDSELFCELLDSEFANALPGTAIFFGFDE